MTFTFAEMIGDYAERTPDAIALAFQGKRTSFGDFHDRGTRLAHVLKSFGVSAGDRVGFLGKNDPVFYEIALACSLLDAVIVGLNWRLSPIELADIASDAGLTLAIASPDQAGLLRIETPTDGPLRIISTGAELNHLLEVAPSTPIKSTTSPASVLFQLYSSGTTGRPKGTLITNANLAFTQASGKLLYGMDSQSVNLVPSPLFHIGGAGYGLTTMSQGGTTVLSPDSDPVTLLRAIEDHRVTHAFLVPAVVQSIVRSSELANFDTSSLRAVAYGGAPMNETLLLEAISALGCEFIGVYGMTETSGTVIALSASDHDPGGPRAHLLRSIGKPLTWAAEVSLRDPNSLAPVPPHKVAEIWVKSGQVTPGYWNQPETTAAALTDDGWLRSGDAAYMDDEGYYFLHDRIKDMVISGGENVYPAEVENALAQHPAVSEVAVIGVPSEKWGESLKAIVVSKPAHVVSESDLVTFARERLAHYKCPTSVDFVSELPRNASGKVLKKDLRAPYWEATSG